MDALKAAGCDEIFVEHGVSAVAKKRPVFDEALAKVGEGDQLVIWKFDRAFRSLSHSLDVLGQLEERGAEFCALTEQIDTSTPLGRLTYQLRNAFAEFEHNVGSERTKAGQAAAWKRGAQKGRPPKLTDMQVEYALDRIEKGEAVSQVAKDLGVSRQTLYNSSSVLLSRSGMTMTDRRKKRK